MIDIIVKLLILLKPWKDRNKEEKDKEKIAKIYPVIKKIYLKRQTEIYNYSLERYPSKKFANKNKSKWLNLVEKQRDFQEQENDKLKKELQEKYSLSQKEIKNISEQIFLEQANKMKEKLKKPFK